MKRIRSRNHIHAIAILTLAGAFACSPDVEQQSKDTSAEVTFMSDYESPGSKWGFIDREGEVQIKARYDLVSGFSEGLAPVNFRGKWGYIDQRGEIKIAFQYLAAWPFSEGFGRVVKFDGQPCFVNRDGASICFSDIDELYDFQSGLARFERSTFFGFLDIAGNIVIDPIYERASGFRKGYARVTRDGRQGLLDTKGVVIIPFVYDRVFDPTDGFVLVRQDSRYKYIALNGGESGLAFDGAWPYQDGVAAVRNGDKWRLVDLQQRDVGTGQYDHIRPAREGRWVARRGDLLGVIDATGSPLTPFIYQQINHFNQGFAVYQRDIGPTDQGPPGLQLWGFMTLNGAELTPPQFGLAWDFKEGLARAAFRNGIAYIDTAGAVPFVPEYFEMQDFSEGLAAFEER